MKKIIFAAMLLMIANCAFAEQISIKLAPAQNITTCRDELEVGDKVLFKVVNKPRLNIAPNSAVIGIVDYVQNNGWMCENAEVQFKKFIVLLDNGKSVTYNSNLTINGFEELKTRNPKTIRFFEYIPTFIRGKEIDIRLDKDTPVYNIWVSM